MRKSERHKKRHKKPGEQNKKWESKQKCECVWDEEQATKEHQIKSECQIETQRYWNKKKMVKEIQEEKYSSHLLGNTA